MTTEDQKQESLFHKFFQACDSGDLKEIKSVIEAINFKHSFHQKNQSSRKFYVSACLSGKLDIVNELAYLAISCKSKKPILNEALDHLIEYNQTKIYPVISYLINSPKLESKRYDNDGFELILHKGLKKAGKEDNLPLFKSLMDFSNSEKNYTYIFSIGYLSLVDHACYNNNIEVFKYIYDYRQKTSNDSRDTAFGLSKACANQNMSILNFLIFEKNIEYTEYVKETIEIYDCDEARKIFMARELNQQLNETNTNTTKKVKL